VTAWRDLRFAKKQQVSLLDTRRVDPEYVIGRGGGAVKLRARTVTLVGCGAVGSRIADRLASIGVGHLRLIDHEVLAAENIHRHVLGASCLGCNKATAIRKALESRFPHIEVEARALKIEAILADEPDFVLCSDLVICATGDETVELRVNDLLRRTVLRIHTWLEPLGIGGHVLALGIAESRGCFQCLFQQDETRGLVNVASFAAPGQLFQRQYAGCGGAFTPFSALDADRTATEAALLAGQVLLGEQQESVLASWFGETRRFVEAGFVLSQRSDLFRAGECRLETAFPVANCPSCSKW
jgi:molybdopterin/thiamine biosynthesis adenylyltransferase